MGYIQQLALLVLASICSGQAQVLSNQTLMIGNDDPCAAELGVPTPSDNLSCEFVAPGGTRCYERAELCNGDLGVSGATPFNRICFTGSDEGANIAALDCKLSMNVIYTELLCYHRRCTDIISKQALERELEPMYQSLNALLEKM